MVGAMNQLKIPPWLRKRDAAELERERKHLATLRWFERMAIAAGIKIRPVEKMTTADQIDTEGRSLRSQLAEVERWKKISITNVHALMNAGIMSFGTTEEGIGKLAAECAALRSQLADAEALLREAIPDASKVCPDTWQAQRDAHLSRKS